MSIIVKSVNNASIGKNLVIRNYANTFDSIVGILKKIAKNSHVPLTVSLSDENIASCTM